MTPLDQGGEIDDDAFEPYARFLAAAGLDGLLALGTTGEGVLFSCEERERVAECYVAAAPEGFAVFVHCGAQTTRDTARLSAHAASTGADGVAVIGPPYFALDERELLAHFLAAAAACAPTPFYLYEFAARSGYPVPVGVVERLREQAPNIRGLKVSDTPFEAVSPYLLDGLEVLIGSEPLLLRAMDRGAAGAVSGLAAGFPDIVARLVHHRDRKAHEEVTRLREAFAGVPFHAAIKAVLRERGLPVSTGVRRPLRDLTEDERRHVLAAARPSLAMATDATGAGPALRRGSVR